MDFFTSLLKAYEKAEEIGLVDQRTGDNDPVLLPLYHTSLKSNGNNIILIKLNKDGTFYKAEFMPDNQSIIFPVTSDSVARSGSNPAPHPLVDKLSYYVQEVSQSQYEEFHNQLANWVCFCKEDEVKDYLEKIQRFILRADFLNIVLNSLFGESYQRENLKVTYQDSNEKSKTIDLSACFIEFSIVQYHGFKDESVTTYKELHQSFISFVRAFQDNMGVCNISGRNETITNKHRGLMGNAKIISVSNKGEAYKGRFKEREDVFSVGYETSEKIHLMIKYLLENNNSNTWLGSSQYLINWFSDDWANKSQLDIVKPEFDSLFEDEDDDIEELEEDMEELSEHINQTKEAYHVIKVTTKTKQSADEITTALYKKHLIASSKLTITESTYIWRNTPITEERYKLEMISRGDKLSQLKYVLEELNDRKNSKIFGAEMNNIPNYMKEQINQYLDVKSNGEK